MNTAAADNWFVKTESVNKQFRYGAKQFCSAHKYDEQSYERSLFVRDFHWAYLNLCQRAVVSDTEAYMVPYHSAIRALPLRNLCDLFACLNTFHVVTSFSIHSNNNDLMYMLKGIEAMYDQRKHFIPAWLTVANNPTNNELHVQAGEMMGGALSVILNAEPDPSNKQPFAWAKFAIAMGLAHKQFIAGANIREYCSEDMGF